MWRRWLYVIVTASLVIGIIAGAEIFSLASESYTQRHPYSHNQYHPVYALLVELFLRGWRWVRDRIDHDIITTIAIAATAVFTGTLYRATNRLWLTSQEHARHMERSIREAERAAAAMERSAAIAEGSQRHFERPYLFVADLLINYSEDTDSAADNVEFTYVIHNYGRTPAIITEIDFGIRYVPT